MRKTLFVLAVVFFCAPSAFAQTGVAGQVIDPSGAPIPDVAVEADTNASGFRTSTTTTDTEGRYRLSLESGLYRLRFTRTGWKTHQVTNVEIPVGRTITIDAQLQVGTLSDTTSISAEPPVIDLRSATRAVSLTGNLIRSLPTARSYNALLVLVPGIVTNSNDTVTGRRRRRSRSMAAGKTRAASFSTASTSAVLRPATRRRSTTWISVRRRTCRSRCPAASARWKPPDW